MKYLFRCKFADGRTYVQTSADVSKKDQSKSAFYDIRDEDIDIFWLEGDGHVYLVNLADGSFEIDGVEFKMHDEDNIATDKELIYHRQHTYAFSGTEEVDHDIEFHFGWKAEDKSGKEIKHIMRIK